MFSGNVTYPSKILLEFDEILPAKKTCLFERILSYVLTLNLFYKLRPAYLTSRPIPNFDSGCLAVVYFGMKI